MLCLGCWMVDEHGHVGPRSGLHCRIALFEEKDQRHRTNIVLISALEQPRSTEILRPKPWNLPVPDELAAVHFLEDAHCCFHFRSNSYSVSRCCSYYHGAVWAARLWCALMNLGLGLGIILVTFYDSGRIHVFQERRGAITFILLSLPLFEVMEVLRIFPVIRCLLVLGELSVICFFGGVGLALINLLIGRLKALPVLPH